MVLCQGAAISTFLEQLDGRALLSGVTEFNGGYVGAFSGHVLYEWNELPVPGSGISDNSFELRILDGAVSLSVPGIQGMGTGTIDANGDFSVTVGGEIQGSFTDVTYSGRLVSTATAVTGSGNWSLATGGPYDSLQGGSGQWSMQQAKNSVFDGHYSGSFKGNVDTGSGDSTVPGPLVEDGTVLVSVTRGLIDVYVPGIDGSGRTVAIISPNGGPLTVDAVGALSGNGITVRYTGIFEIQDLGDGSSQIIASGFWSIVNTPGVLGSGTWTVSQLPLSRPVIDTVANPLTTIDQRPEITWSPVDFAFQYDVFIANVATPHTPIIRVRTSSTRYVPTVDLGIGRLQVWVQAISGAYVRSAWSVPLNLRIRTAPVVGPVSFYASNSRPEFTWSDVAGSAGYELWIDNRLTGVAQVIRTEVGGSTFTPAADLNGGIYRYWVRGIGADGFIGQWSAFAEIYVGPGQISPVQPTFSTLPVFEWSGVGGVASYDVWLQRNSSVIATPMGITGTTWSPGSAMTPGDYRWWVRPTLTGGVKGPWSQMQHFNVGGIPTINAPAAITATTNIAWTPVMGATSYDLFIRRDFDGQAFIQQVNQSGTNRNVATSLRGDYRVWVRTISTTSVVSNWSRPLSFTVADAIDAGDGVLEKQTNHLNLLSLPFRVTSDQDQPEVMIYETQLANVSADGNTEMVRQTNNDLSAFDVPSVSATTTTVPVEPLGQDNCVWPEDQVIADWDQIQRLLEL